MFFNGVRKKYGNQFNERDIENFWHQFKYVSANSEARRPLSSRNKQIYQHIRSNDILTEFQFDLVFITKNISKSKYKSCGHLIAIDINSRALFQVPFKKKSKMALTFSKLYLEIKKLQKPEFLQDDNRQTYFYSDLGRSSKKTMFGYCPKFVGHPPPTQVLIP